MSRAVIIWCAGLAAGALPWCWMPTRVVRLPARATESRPTGAGGLGLRAGWALGSGVAALVWLPSPWGWFASLPAAGAAWILAGRSEPAAVRRARREAQADLPHLVALLAATLRSGSAPQAGLELVCQSLPGAAADRLEALRNRLALGADPGDVWSELAADPVLGPLGRCLARAHQTGAPVAAAIERLAVELARGQRAAAEDRARAVGVKAALPLGLCLLPAFLLLGIVPVVASLAESLLAAR